METAETPFVLPPRPFVLVSPTRRELATGGEIISILRALANFDMRIPAAVVGAVITPTGGRGRVEKPVCWCWIGITFLHGLARPRLEAQKQRPDTVEKHGTCRDRPLPFEKSS